jgi:hypothetical protein
VTPDGCLTESIFHSGVPQVITRDITSPCLFTTDAKTPLVIVGDASVPLSFNIHAASPGIWQLNQYLAPPSVCSFGSSELEFELVHQINHTTCFFTGKPLTGHPACVDSWHKSVMNGRFLIAGPVEKISHVPDEPPT